MDHVYGGGRQLLDEQAGEGGNLSAGEIILVYVCPALGSVMALLMFTAPVRSVKEAVAKGSLGSLNPTPWAFMTGNCVGWVAYGLLTNDPFVYVANAPGFIISVWLNLCAAKLVYQSHATNRLRSSMTGVLLREESAALRRLSSASPQKGVLMQHHVTGEVCDDDPLEDCPNGGTIGDQQHGLTQATSADDEEEGVVGVESIVGQIWDQSVQLITLEKAPVAHEIMVVFIVTFWTLVFGLVTYIPMTPSQRQFTVGIIVNLNLLFFYGAPLSTIWTVLTSRNSSSIHVRTMITNTINGAFWFAYGLGIGDWLITVPNGIGSLLGIVQMTLCVLFPRSSKGANNRRQTTEEGRVQEDSTQGV